MAISLFLAAFIWVTITDDLVMKSESQKSKHTGRRPKFDYKSEEFLSQVETYAKKGFTDKEIASISARACNYHSGSACKVPCYGLGRYQD